MLVTVDIAQVLAVVKAAEKALPRVAVDAHRVLVAKAREEKSTHGYRNRTYRLQGSTFAMGPVTFGADSYGSEFGARADYASFVEARGLSNVTGLAREAEDEIQQMHEMTARFVAAGL
jgi:hypothetical protein